MDIEDWMFNYLKANVGNTSSFSPFLWSLKNYDGDTPVIGVPFMPETDPLSGGVITPTFWLQFYLIIGIQINAQFFYTKIPPPHLYFTIDYRIDL